MNRRLRRPVAAVAWGVAGLLGVVLLLGVADTGPAPGAVSSSPAPPAVQLPPPEGASQARLHAGDERSLERAPSLRGTDWDGDWALDATTGLPSPSLRLRQRFDHLLSQLGERPLPVLREQLRARMAAEGLPPHTQQAILRVFDAYTAVGQHPYRVQADPRAPHTWPAALAERQQVRRQHLGVEWVEAFWGEDDRALMASLQALRGEGPAPPPEIEPPRHPQAAAREAALDAEWRDWERRLDAARAQWQALARDASRSAPQREQAWQQHLDGHFDAAEQLRVRALVEGAPSSSLSAGSP